MFGSEKNLQNKRAYLLRILYNRIETKNYRRIQNMLTLHDTQSNLQGVIVKKVTLDNNFIIINIEMDKTAHICPNCGYTRFIEWI